MQTKHAKHKDAAFPKAPNYIHVRSSTAPARSAPAVLLQPRQAQQVPAAHEPARSLAVDVHGDAEEADGDLDAGDDVEGLGDAVLQDPVVGAPGQAEAEHVLEDEERREGLDGYVAYAPHTHAC